MDFHSYVMQCCFTGGVEKKYARITAIPSMLQHGIWYIHVHPIKSYNLAYCKIPPPNLFF